MNWVNEDAKTAYDMLIDNGSPEKLEGYCEEHHIIPRSRGGTDEPENLTYLTASTHLYVHYWLWVGTGDSRMGHAYFQMANTGRSKYDATPLVTEAMVLAYESARIDHSKAHIERMKLRTGEKNPMFGKTHSAETRAMMRACRVGVPRSAETRVNIGKAKCGEKNPMFGKTGSLHNRSKKVLVRLDCGLTLSYGSGSEVARCFGLIPSTISYRCTKGIKGFSYATNNDVSTTGENR